MLKMQSRDRLLFVYAAMGAASGESVQEDEKSLNDDNDRSGSYSCVLAASRVIQSRCGFQRLPYRICGANQDGAIAIFWVRAAKN